MQWLLGFLLRYKNLFLYLFFVISIIFFSYYQSEYHKSKIFKASIFINGKTSEPLKKLTSYFKLKKINILITELNRLINQYYDIYSNIDFSKKSAS